VSASERRIAELENEVHKLRELLKRTMRAGETLEMESGVNPKLEAFITIRWGDMGGQLSPDEARQHGLRMLECAEAAEADAALLRGMRKLEWDEDTGYQLLRLIRENRTGDPERSA
jgi:hypothetical protein